MAKERRRRRMDAPYGRISEVREADTSDEANGCLNTGFVLINAVERRGTDPIGRQTTSVVYILGKPKGNEARKLAKNRHPNETVNLMDDTPNIVPAILECRPWKAYASGEGEWTFVVNKDGSPVPELQPAEEFLNRLKTVDDLVVGRYRYRLRDKFLKRYPADGQSN